MIHRLQIILSTLILTLLFVSCSAKKQSSSAAFKLYLGAQVLNNYSFTLLRANPVGELKNEDGTLRKPFETTLGDKVDGIVEIPNGSWIFQVVAFESADIASSVAHCGEFGPINLTGADATVEIVINESNCSLVQNQNLVTELRTKFSNNQGQINSPPIANSFAAADIIEEASATINLTYADPEGDQATSCSIFPINGLSVQGCTCSGGSCVASVSGLTDFYGAASFNYTVSTSAQISNVATVNFNITNVDDAPVGTLSAPSNGMEDTAITVNLSYSDAENDEATTCSVSALTNATIATACACTSGSCSVGLMPTPDFYGIVNFSYQVQAAGATSSLQTVSLQIDPMDDAPVAMTPSYEYFGDNQPFSITLPYTDVENDLATSCTVSAIPQTSNCMCSAGVCTATITPNIGDRGSYNYIFTVTSNGLSSGTGNGVFEIYMGCPLGYIPVNGTPEFCVMKYEARNVSSIPTSDASATPWANISINDAYTFCSQISEPNFTGQFGLILNSEWIAIAQNIEQHYLNWSTSTVGSGTINRGASAFTPADPFTNTVPALSSDPSYLYNSGADAYSPSGSFNFKRTHTLSNGEEIWDFSGNVREWVDWGSDDLDAQFTPGPNTVSQSYTELNAPTGALTLAEIGMVGNYTSTHEVGKLYGGPSGIATRGGSYNDGIIAGIYNLNLHSNGGLGAADTGFRCVYRPGP